MDALDIGQFLCVASAFLRHFLNCTANLGYAPFSRIQLSRFRFKELTEMGPLLRRFSGQEESDTCQPGADKLIVCILDSVPPDSRRAHGLPEVNSTALGRTAGRSSLFVVRHHFGCTFIIR